MSSSQPSDLRASDADREAAVQRLRHAAHDGRLDSEELEQRVHAAYSARHCRELDALTLDVTPPPTPAPAPEPVTRQLPVATNAMAVTSLAFGALWLGWFGSVVAIVCGHIALAQIRESGGRQSGQGLAVAGLVLGYGAIAMFAMVLVLAAGI